MADPRYTPKEDAEAFKKRHGVDRDEYVEHLDDLLATADNLGFGGKKNKDGIESSTLSPFNLFQTIRSAKSLGLEITDVYTANSHGLRSYDFIKQTDGDKKHVLFAGCSVTFGDGLMIEQLWSYKLYQALGGNLNLSGFFSVARNGATITEIFMQVINYMSTFGVPGKLIIMLPENIRDVEMGKVVDQEFADKLILSLYKSIKKICKDHDSELYVFSWDALTVNKGEYILCGDENFYEFENDDKAKHMFNFAEKNKDDQFSAFMMNALDLVHPGIAEQDFYYSFMLTQITGEQHVIF